MADQDFRPSKFPREDDRRKSDRRQFPVTNVEQPCTGCAAQFEVMLSQRMQENREFYEKKLDEALSRKFGELKRLFESAFPNKDPVGHRIAHEKYIKDADFYKGVKEKVVVGVITAVLVAVLGFAFTAIWIQFLRGPQTEQHPPNNQGTKP